ncbi:MAG: DUF3748 domain-containing protein [Planctomycetaceae bacterium]|nr:DUF3748 domain-containing protein [Planctomycetaceae bacterium]
MRNMAGMHIFQLLSGCLLFLVATTVGQPAVGAEPSDWGKSFFNNAAYYESIAPPEVIANPRGQLTRGQAITLLSQTGKRLIGKVPAFADGDKDATLGAADFSLMLCTVLAQAGVPDAITIATPQQAYRFVWNDGFILGEHATLPPPDAPVTVEQAVALAYQAFDRYKDDRSGEVATLGEEKQLTFSDNGHMLTNRNVFSPDSKWVVYDVRPVASQFAGETIEKVHVDSGEIKVLYRDPNGAKVGVVTYNPAANQVAFIKGPDKNAPDQAYSSYNRQGLVHDEATGRTFNLDARDLTPPFTPGALRGGTHVHIWHPTGLLNSDTYEDKILSAFKEENADHDKNSRAVAVSVAGMPVKVDAAPGNHDGEYYTFLASVLNVNAKPGTDDVYSALEEGFIGADGYVKTDGTRQKFALAFQGKMYAKDGSPLTEIFVVDLPEDMTKAGAGPIEGTATRRPLPPQGTTQRRITYTEGRRYPGVVAAPHGPRHWLKSTSDGEKIVFYARDDRGIVQAFHVSPNGGEPVQITANDFSIQSEFTISPDDKYLVYAADGSLFRTEIADGATLRLTPREKGSAMIFPDAVVYSPDGKKVVYEKWTPKPGAENQGFYQLFLYRFN